jgi:hypothetical protein
MANEQMAIQQMHLSLSSAEHVLCRHFNSQKNESDRKKTKITFQNGCTKLILVVAVIDAIGEAKTH